MLTFPAPTIIFGQQPVLATQLSEISLPGNIHRRIHFPTEEAIIDDFSPPLQMRDTDKMFPPTIVNSSLHASEMNQEKIIHLPEEEKTQVEYLEKIHSSLQTTNQVN